MTDDLSDEDLRDSRGYHPARERVTKVINPKLFESGRF
jgi:hypothetical protein